MTMQVRLHVLKTAYRLLKKFYSHHGMHNIQGMASRLDISENKAK